MCKIVLLGFVYHIDYKIIKHSVSKVVLCFCLQVKRGVKWIGFQSSSALKMEAESSFQNIEFYNLYDE
jgi:hypothetical protein